MKKILFTVAIAAMFGLGLTSCDNDNGKCYKVTYTAGIVGIGAEETVYEWLNEDQISTQRAKYEAEGYTSITFTVVEGYTSSAACIALGNLTEHMGE